MRAVLGSMREVYVTALRTLTVVVVLAVSVVVTSQNYILWWGA